jgi:hypothetical protein
MPKSRLTPHDPQWDLIAVMTQVRSGALTPDQAEEWAKANGYGPFVPEVNDDFIAERYWPFALAMAWIATREAAALRLWGGYKTWGTRQYELDDRLAPARDALLTELRKGELVASGRPNWQGPHEAAPVIAWLDLHLVRYGSHDRFCREDGSVAYFDVVLDGRQIQAKWARPRPGETKVRQTVASEADAVRRLTQMMRESPNEPIPKAQLKLLFESISGRAFERAFSKAVTKADAPAWSASGRRPRRTRGLNLVRQSSHR